MSYKSPKTVVAESVGVLSSLLSLSLLCHLATFLTFVFLSFHRFSSSYMVSSMCRGSNGLCDSTCLSCLISCFFFVQCIGLVYGAAWGMVRSAFREKNSLASAIEDFKTKPLIRVFFFGVSFHIQVTPFPAPGSAAATRGKKDTQGPRQKSHYAAALLPI